MNHPFLPSQLNQALCQRCKRQELDHTELAVCEACNNIGPCEIQDTILMCASCQELNKNHMSEENQEKRVKEFREKIAASQQLDQSIRYDGDLYNAATVAIVELKKLAYSDDSLTDEEKHYKWVSLISERRAHLQSVLIEHYKETRQIESEVAALQRTLNENVPTLRQEWRAKFAQNDVHYKPPAITKPAKLPTIRSKNPLDRMAATYAQQMKLVDKYYVFKDANQLLETADKVVAEIKAKEIGGIVKEVTAIDQAKRIIEKGMKDLSSE